MDWGRKMPDAKAGKPLPKPVNFKEQVLRHIQGTWGSGLRKLTLTAIIRHLVDDDTAYFTASPGDETILMVDIDCHAKGTLEGATQFAQHLKENYFPDLYYEVSTNGGGVHGFVVVDKRLWKNPDYKAVLVEVEKWLKRVLRSTDFDVEDVELKGTPLTVSVGKPAGRGEERHLRLPGEDAEGLEEVRRVAVHDPHDGARAAQAAGAVPGGGSRTGT